MELNLSSRSDSKDGAFHEDQENQLTRRQVIANLIMGNTCNERNQGNAGATAPNQGMAESEFEERNDEPPAFRIPPNEAERLLDRFAED